MIVGLVAGWALHPITDRLGNPPVVSWLQPIALCFVAAVLLATAWVTHRALHVRGSGWSRTARSTGWCWPGPASWWADWSPAATRAMP